MVVTGATGFLGAALVAALERGGADVRGVARRPRRGEPAVDVTDAASLDAVLGSNRPADCVVHTAAQQGARAPRARCVAVNVHGTENVLRATHAAGARRFVFISSIAVLGFRYPDGAGEDAPSVGGDAYADSKVAAEHVVRSLAAELGIEATILRLGDLWGAGSAAWVEQPLRRIRAGTFRWVAGGRGNLDLLHIDDAVTGVTLAMAHPAAAGGTFFLTDGASGTTVRDYFAGLAAAAGVELRARSVPASAVRWLGGGLRYLDRAGWVSCARARRDLGYAPTVDLDAGMRRLARHFAVR